ncbi:hypothetical protein AVEN_6892-1 [Araneus ventricosus]|uniref:Uncharacterized protein n=1 Tax=Araneus ventricosus TaxID=182803 RepID=A0A4Y2ULE0_ARAVE|nr:hypothetical protein AVEN_135710-1 [Araneus ventricosus]GBO12399.1 hypothetical protein AVEN_6892-1 [Araneus ventricosus]
MLAEIGVDRASVTSLNCMTPIFCELHVQSLFLPEEVYCEHVHGVANTVESRRKGVRKTTAVLSPPLILTSSWQRHPSRGLAFVTAALSQGHSPGS